MTEQDQAITEEMLVDAALLQSACDEVPVYETRRAIERDLEAVSRFFEVQRNWQSWGGTITGNICAAEVKMHVVRLIAWHVRTLYRGDPGLDVEAWLETWGRATGLVQ